MNKLQLLIDNFKNQLGSSLLFCEMWNKETQKEVAHLNHNEDYIAVFTAQMTHLENGLQKLGFPSFKTYQLTRLNMNSLHLLINFENEHLLGCLLDNEAIDINLLINTAIPEILENYAILKNEK